MQVISTSWWHGFYVASLFLCVKFWALGCGVVLEQSKLWVCSYPALHCHAQAVTQCHSQIHRWAHIARVSLQCSDQFRTPPAHFTTTIFVSLLVVLPNHLGLHSYHHGFPGTESHQFVSLFYLSIFTGVLFPLSFNFLASY